jgi:hypothetical protein
MAGWLTSPTLPLAYGEQQYSGITNLHQIKKRKMHWLTEGNNTQLDEGKKQECIDCGQ